MRQEGREALEVPVREGVSREIFFSVKGKESKEIIVKI